MWGTEPQMWGTEQRDLAPTSLRSFWFPRKANGAAGAGFPVLLGGDLPHQTQIFARSRMRLPRFVVWNQSITKSSPLAREVR